MGGPHGPPPGHPGYRPPMPGAIPPGLVPQQPTPLNDESEEDGGKKGKKGKSKKSADGTGAAPKEKKPRSRPSKKKVKKDAEGNDILAEFEAEEAALEAAAAVPDPDAPPTEGAEATAVKKKRARPRPKKKPVPEGTTEAGAALTGEEANAKLADGEVPMETDADGNKIVPEGSQAVQDKKPKVKSNTPKRPKPNKTNLLQFTKKKRKRSDSGSDADLDFVEREEEEDDDLLSDKRRSGRRAGPRKKYVDDVQLDLSDDENLLMNLPPEARAAAKAAREADKAAEAAEAAAAAASSSEAKDDSGTVTPKETGEDQLKAPPNSEDVSAEVTQSGPNYAYVDPTAEDTMVVQLILASRMGTREL